MTLPLFKHSCRLIFFVCATFLVVGLLIDQTFAGKSGNRRSSGRRSKSVSRQSDRDSTGTRGSSSQYTSVYSGGDNTSRHSRGRAPGRSNDSKPRHKSKSIGVKLGRVADKMAVGLSLYSSASINYIENYSLNKVQEYVQKAAKYRMEKYTMIDDIGYNGDEISYYKEEWATRVAEVALGFHRMITKIYKAISGKRDKHADNVRQIKGELVKQRSMNDRADPGTKAAYNFERGQEEYVKEALSTMKKDLKYINQAENIKNHMDLLTMFFEFYNRSNDYYKDYFKANMMDETYEVVEDVMDQIDSSYDLINTRRNRVHDPGTSQRIRDAVVHDIGGGSKRRSRGGERQRSSSKNRDYSAYDSRYSYSYSDKTPSRNRRKSGGSGGDRRRRHSGSSKSDKGQSSRYLTNG